MNWIDFKYNFKWDFSISRFKWKPKTTDETMDFSILITFETRKIETVKMNTKWNETIRKTKEKNEFKKHKSNKSMKNEWIDVYFNTPYFYVIENIGLGPLLIICVNTPMCYLCFKCEMHFKLEKKNQISQCEFIERTMEKLERRRRRQMTKRMKKLFPNNF